MQNAARLLEEAMQLSEDEREELAARLLDSSEPPPGISVEDRDEIERRVVVFDTVDVIAVAHAKRRPRYWRRRL